MKVEEIQKLGRSEPKEAGRLWKQFVNSCSLVPDVPLGVEKEGGRRGTMVNMKGMAGTKPFVKRWLSVVFSLIIFFAIVIVILKRVSIKDGLDSKNTIPPNTALLPDCKVWSAWGMHSSRYNF